MPLQMKGYIIKKYCLEKPTYFNLVFQTLIACIPYSSREDSRLISYFSFYFHVLTWILTLTIDFLHLDIILQFGVSLMLYFEVIQKFKLR